ncbi:hypothetical protein NUH88_20285 [Nisaea acidiphila]|uniref:Uncharacterized protein n=1 Tax=Nisaea acidiphila TaxID=1862145 RepID=A0A9J7ATS5_9PROT|nr:hypothetical protein [Nisaea acidiphila]UUX49724.1 hypothetical protein NUH88_20285 [Nisaea acidiphila]
MTALFWSAPVGAETDKPLTFLPDEIQGLWEIAEIDYGGISAVGPDEVGKFVGRRIRIGNADLDLFGYRCRIDRYEAELIDNEAGFFGERFLFSNDLATAGLRKAPDFYPERLMLELKCAEGDRPPVREEDAIFFCLGGGRLDGKGFDYFGGGVLVTSCDGAYYVLQRVSE